MDYGDIGFESFYQGGGSSFEPEYGNFAGYRLHASQLGFPGSPQTANQLGESINALKQGTKAFEVQLLSPDTAETIPAQHFKEMRALMKLSGVKPSVHGPLIDAAGFGEKGSWEGEEARQNNERRMFDTLKKAQILAPEGGVPVVFHVANGVPGEEWRPGNEKVGEDRFVLNRGAAINRETGQVVSTSREYKFRPKHPELLDKGEVEGGPRGILFSADDSVRSYNNTDWDKKLLEVAEMNKHVDEIISPNDTVDLGKYHNAYIAKDEEGVKIVSKDASGNIIELPPLEEGSKEAQAYDQMRKADLFIENAELSFGSAFNQAWKYGTPEQQTALKKLSEDYKKDLASVNGQMWSPLKRKKILDDAIEDLRAITKEDAPHVYENVTDFAIEKASETFGNLAARSYEELNQDKAPKLAIEHVLFGMGLSRADQLKAVIEKSRDNFVDFLMQKKGLSENDAKRLAEDKIGATWDTGHINIMKKYGFNDKDIIEETKKITPLVKHIHITDNFGYADTHLGPGMGNVPIKEILGELEKNGRYDEMRKIVEAGGFVQHFKKSPFPASLAAFGSPIYGMKRGMGWNQTQGVEGSYFGGYGTTNPQTHHSYFGAGFTNMPVELGGQMPGGNSRFGGTPMA